MRHQTSGDVDESKLIEGRAQYVQSQMLNLTFIGVTGEKAVYRRRAEKEPEPGTPPQKPKRLRVCF